MLEDMDLLPLELAGSRLLACCFSLLHFLLRFLPRSIEMLLRWLSCLIAVTTCPSSTLSAPPGFPSSGNGLWYTSQGTRWAYELLPVGNGYLAGMCWSYQSTLSLRMHTIHSDAPWWHFTGVNSAQH